MQQILTNTEMQDVKYASASSDPRQIVLDHFAKTLAVKPFDGICHGGQDVVVDDDDDMKMTINANTPESLDTSINKCSGCGSVHLKITCASCYRAVLCRNLNCCTRAEHLQDCGILQNIDKRTELLRRQVCLTGIWLYRSTLDTSSTLSLSHETAILGTPLDFSERKMSETSSSSFINANVKKTMAEQQLGMQLLKQWLYENHAPCILACVTTKTDGKRHVSFIPILSKGACDSAKSDMSLGANARVLDNVSCIESSSSATKSCPLCRVPCIKCSFCTLTVACPRKRSPCHVPGQRSCRRDCTLLLQVLTNVQYY